MDDKATDSLEEAQDSSWTTEQPQDIASSPSSNSNSSSTRRNRVVELLVEEVPIDANWTLRREFYDEDIGDDEDAIDQEDDDDIEVPSDDEQSDMSDIDEEINYRQDPPEDEFFNWDDRYGWVMTPLRASSDEEEDNENANAQDGQLPVDYDRTLPVNHPYLGDDLNESRGTQMLLECSKTNMLLLDIEHVLFPGQTLPLITRGLEDDTTAELAVAVRNSVKTIGIISKPMTNKIGTTAEIRSYSFLEGEDQNMKLIMDARQRFRILSAPFECCSWAQIEILPEITLGHPYPRISSLLKFQAISETSRSCIVWKHPHWLLHRYDARYLVNNIWDQIKYWFSINIAMNPTEFSYWVASNLPMNDRSRARALGFTTTEDRLIWLSETLKSSDNLVCAECNNVICYRKDIFSMSHSGPQCTFVNPTGCIQDTITVRKAIGVMHAYKWTQEFTWFPDYAWRYALCKTCNEQVGWSYKHVDGRVRPKRFYGLSRKKVRLQINCGDS